jgi:hypothetical protein
MSLEYTWYSYDSKREKKNIYILFLKKKKKKKTSHIAPDYERRSSLRKRERKLWAMKW